MMLWFMRPALWKVEWDKALLQTCLAAAHIRLLKHLFNTAANLIPSKHYHKDPHKFRWPKNLVEALKTVREAEAVPSILEPEPPARISNIPTLPDLAK